jgi:thiosulfate/3-mercaptopyruvate sulfurtransferase
MVDTSPIITPESLHARLGSPALRIVDVRWVLGQPGGGRAAYDTGHLPGSIFLDLDTDLAARQGPGRHPLPEAGTFRERLEVAGIGDADEVVAYDDVSGSVAARLWWMLDDLGHERVRVLDGGIQGWVAAGFPLTTEAPEPRARGRLHLRGAWTRVIDRAEVASGLGGFVLLDARSGPRYRGEVEPIDAVPGHIPTARNAPVDGNVGPDGRLLPAGELAERFRTLDAAGPAGFVVTSCGSGVTACFTGLAMRIAGLPDPVLYPGSYSDWSRAGMLVAVGSEPGDRPDEVE